MKILMAGLDYTLANIEEREKFSFTKSMIELAYSEIIENENILGTVIISTCNRTEIYLSCKATYKCNPFEILCGLLKIKVEGKQIPYYTKENEEVLRHLSHLACGVKSQIWGEDQIITQVKNAIVMAREFGTTDSYLEVLFRNAVTAGKKIKSTLRLSTREASVVYKALNILEEKDSIQKVLVIGNGEIGKLMAKVLQKNGYETLNTLRQYTSGSLTASYGIIAVDYAKRYEVVEKVDAVISATLSPHYTCEKDEILNLKNYPKLWIDLALPRDIETSIKELDGVELYDIDSISAEEIKESHREQLKEIDIIIDKYILEYRKWCDYKKNNNE